MSDQDQVQPPTDLTKWREAKGRAQHDRTRGRRATTKSTTAGVTPIGGTSCGSLHTPVDGQMSLFDEIGGN